MSTDPKKSHGVQIAVAIVGLLGVLGAAVIGNWGTFFSTSTPENPELNNVAPKNTTVREAENLASKWVSAWFKRDGETIAQLSGTPFAIRICGRGLNLQWNSSPSWFREGVALPDYRSKKKKKAHSFKCENRILINKEAIRKSAQPPIHVGATRNHIRSAKLVAIKTGNLGSLKPEYNYFETQFFEKAGLDSGDLAVKMDVSYQYVFNSTRRAAWDEELFQPPSRRVTHALILVFKEVRNNIQLAGYFETDMIVRLE